MELEDRPGVRDLYLCFQAYMHVPYRYLDPLGCMSDKMEAMAERDTQHNTECGALTERLTVAIRHIAWPEKGRHITTLGSMYIP